MRHGEQPKVTRLKKVLLIEDDPDLAELMAENFRRMDCVCVQAESRDAALKLLDETVDAIIADYMMPGMSLPIFVLGIERLAGKPIPFVLISAYDEAKYEAGTLGVSFLRKPFPFADLLNAISASLVGRKSSDIVPAIRS